jgi:biotin carboxyl carrier protein
MTKSSWRDGERVREVELEPLGGRRWRVDVDQSTFEVEAEPLADGRLRLVFGSDTMIAEVTAAGARCFVRLGALDFVIERETSIRRRTGASVTGGLEAPMPGVVTRVLVTLGDKVVRGQPLVAVEAMKMEHVIRAPRDGQVTAVRAAAGEMVAPGTPLLELGE